MGWVRDPKGGISEYFIYFGMRTAKILNLNIGNLTNSNLQAALDKATSLGYTLPTGTDLTNINNFMKDLNTKGILSQLDALRVYKNANNLQFASIDLINANATKSISVNSPSLDNSKGSYGNGTNSYINLNVTPNTLTNFTQNNGTAFTYLGDTFNVTDSGGVPCYFGCDDLGLDNLLFAFINPTNFIIRVNDAGGTSGVGLPQATGLQLIQRLSGTTANFIQNGTTYPVTMASLGVPNVSVYLHCRNSTGTANLFTTAKQALWGIGNGLAGYEAALKTACDAFYAA